MAISAGEVKLSYLGRSTLGANSSVNISDHMDSNGDGEITLEEFSARQMEMQKSAFEMLDANNDDGIDNEEWDKFLEMHGYDVLSKS